MRTYCPFNNFTVGGSVSSPVAGRDVYYGYRVLSVLPDGPSSNAILFPDSSGSSGSLKPSVGQLVVWWDYIITINGNSLLEEGDYEKFLKESEDNTALLEVFNIKSMKLRTLQVNIVDGDIGIEGVFNSLLTLGPDSEESLHVVEVYKDSPADSANIVPFEDYIVGSRDTVFPDVDSFAAEIEYLVQNTTNPKIHLFVYRPSNDTIREVCIPISNEPWGKFDSVGLGLELSAGHLHALPSDCRRTTGRNYVQSTNTTPVPQVLLVFESSPASSPVGNSSFVLGSPPLHPLPAVPAAEMQHAP